MAARGHRGHRQLPGPRVRRRRWQRAEQSSVPPVPGERADQDRVQEPVQHRGGDLQRRPLDQRPHRSHHGAPAAALPAGRRVTGQGGRRPAARGRGPAGAEPRGARQGGREAGRRPGDDPEDRRLAAGAVARRVERARGGPVALGRPPRAAVGRAPGGLRHPERGRRGVPARSRLRRGRHVHHRRAVHPDRPQRQRRLDHHQRRTRRPADLHRAQRQLRGQPADLRVRRQAGPDAGHPGDDPGGRPAAGELHRAADHRRPRGPGRSRPTAWQSRCGSPRGTARPAP